MAMAGYRQPVLDGARIFLAMGPADVLAATASVRMSGFPVPPLAAVALGAPPAVARVNHNRWIADCPDCAGAADVWRDGPHLMICPNCLNATIGHLWRRVALPDDIAAIEDALMDRPVPQTRNWSIAESVDDLRRQNAERGL
jgi:hypothetical protein